jgi:RNA-binding protein 25
LTLYVGKISTAVDDSVIRALLEACGKVKSWKPMLDPDTQKPKGFGFCEYEEPQGAIMALQLLNKLELGGQELLLKYNTTTEKYIQQWEANKKVEGAKAKAKIGEEAEQSTEGEASKEEAVEEGEAAEASRENEALARVMAIVSEHAAKASARTGGTAAAAADEFLSGLKEADHSGRRRDEPRHRAPRDPGERSERHLEAEYARERELAAKKEKELQRAYEDLERSWLRHERCAYPPIDRLRGLHFLAPIWAMPPPVSRCRSE